MKHDVLLSEEERFYLNSTSYVWSRVSCSDLESVSDEAIQGNVRPDVLWIASLRSQ